MILKHYSIKADEQELGLSQSAQRLADGQLVDHTYGKPHCWWFRYDHSLVMEGLTLGLKTMREGGQRQVHVPALLAVSQRADEAGIPAGVDLILDVALVEAPR